MAELQTKILRVLRSERFFWAIMALFVLESAWIAVSAAYPMVFDENTHFGVIQLYAHHLSPVWLHQPQGADFAGPLVRQPSYMLQYLLSFPYRLITLFTSNQAVSIITLRLINVALFGAGLFLFRRLLLKTRVSPAIIHTVLLFFILTPVVPLLAGQINYDNLIMLVTPIALLIATNVQRNLKRGRLSYGQLSILLAVCMFGSLVQFEFLPIFAAIVLWLVWCGWQQYKKKGFALRQSIADSWNRSSWARKAYFGLPLLIMLGLFIEMYGVNLAQYHNLTPQCGQVLSEQQCQAYAPWQRNQAALAQKGTVNSNPVLFGASWIYRMFVASFYTSSGGASPSAFYISVNPMPVIFVTALMVFLGGVVLVLAYRSALFERYKYLGFLLFVSLFYALALWLRNYHDFIHFGQKLAINGRYIFPVVLPAMLIVALAYRQLFAEKHHLKLGLVIVVLALFLQGGGALTYIAVSNHDWYWQNRLVLGMNKTAQQIVRPMMLVKTPLKSFGRIPG